MAEYDFDRSREFSIVGRGLKAPSSNWVDVKCPFCQHVSRAYVWSLSGGGKKCENRKCGAKHNSVGMTAPLKGRGIEGAGS